MWSRIFAGIIASATLVAASTAAMSAGDTGPCRVVNGEKLPKDSGGSAAICSEIEHAAAVKAANVPYKAQVRVLSKTALAVDLEVNGRKLDEQHFAIVDRNINPTFIKRVAEAIAEQIATAPKKA